MTTGACGCGAALVRDEASAGHGARWRCPRCGYEATPRAADADARALHAGGHPSAAQGAVGERFPALIARVRQACADFRVARALRGGARGAALDFGCGQGFYLAALTKQGFAASGVEISAATAARARARGYRVVTALDDLGAQRFAALVSIHSLEHLDAPRVVLRALSARLTPGARFLIEVPDATGWQARLFGTRWLHREQALHVHHFSTPALVGLLASEGYRTERVGHYSFEHGLLGWIQSLYNLVFPYNRFFRTVVLNSHAGAWWSAWPEVLLFPLALPIGALAFAAEALAGRGAVIRATGRFVPDFASGTAADA